MQIENVCSEKDCLDEGWATLESQVQDYNENNQNLETNEIKYDKNRVGDCAQTISCYCLISFPLQGGSQHNMARRTKVHCILQSPDYIVSSALLQMQVLKTEWYNGNNPTALQFLKQMQL